MDRLKQLRKASNLNQVTVASVLNISREAYSMYETGKRQPSYDALTRLADYYAVNIDYLLERTDIPDKIPYITREELDLIKKVRLADERGRANIYALAEYEAKHSLL